LTIYQSNKMAALAQVFCHQLKVASTDRSVFDPDIVLVQNFGIGQWLKFQLAEADGIAANVDCLTPANFIWRLLQQLDVAEGSLSADGSLPADGSSSYERENLTWRILALLPDLDPSTFSLLHDYCDGPQPQLRGFQLASKLAGLFDQYLVHRPDWIRDWDEGGDVGDPDGWQPALWRRLRADLGEPHRAELAEQLLRRLQTGPIPGMPAQLSIFGLSSMPVAHLAIFQSVAAHIPVDIYFLNPCQHYWGDIVSASQKARRSVRDLLGHAITTEDDYLRVGNPLLASMGRQGREFLELLLAYPGADMQDIFIDRPAQTALGYLQRDILEMTHAGSDAPQPEAGPVFRIGPDDISIQIHSCHSKIRECEVLYDSLMRMFEQASDLSARDVIVMMPDVAQYAPFIHAVFKGLLPYRIVDRSQREESPVLVSLQGLLRLPSMRLSAAEVMDFLEVPTIARRLDLSDADLSRLAGWIRDAGIRWGADGKAKSRWSLPEDGHNTWHFGLRRLLLGYAMGDGNDLFAGSLPHNIPTAESELLGKFADFVDLLIHHQSSLREPRTALEWQATVSEMLDCFYAPEPLEELELDIVRTALADILAETRATAFDEPLTLTLFQYWLGERLQMPASQHGIGSNGVTFCTLIPMRSIPFRSVALIGMNDLDFPRRDQPLQFDLIARGGPRRGDRSRRLDDRYLFLEALISAEDYLYLSFQGRTPKDNKPRPPSVLVDELTTYMQTTFGEAPVTHHPLQPFDEAYYDPDFPDLITFNRNWYNARKNPAEAEPFIDGELELPDGFSFEEIELEDLVAFFRHPAQYFLQNRLSVRLPRGEEEMLDTESFTLSPLDRYAITTSALDAQLAGVRRDPWQERVVASGIIGDNQASTEMTDGAWVAAQRIASMLADARDATPEQHLIRISVSSGLVIGSVTLIDGDQLFYRTGTLRQRQLIEHWVRHLAINVGVETSTRLIDSVGIKTLNPVPRDIAAAQMETLATMYRNAFRKPLPFMPETSRAWYDGFQRHQSEADGNVRAMREWTADRPGGEGQDPAYQRLHVMPGALDEDFAATAQQIFEPLLRYLST